MANLQTTVKLRHMEKRRARQPASPLAIRLLLCGWLSFHGYAAILDSTVGPMRSGLQSANAQVFTGGTPAGQDGTGNGPQTVPADEPPTTAEGTNTEADVRETQTGPAPPPPTVTPEQQEKINSLIEQLSAPKFSQRESAATALLQIGLPALPSLRKQAAVTGEPETQIRLNELIKQLIDGQIEVQIQDFMAMKPVEFEGWPEIRLILGDDTIATRTLFVEILRAHPTLPASMPRDQTNRDRTIAMESVIAAMEKKRTKQLPTSADAFALILPTIYPDFVMPEASEDLVISAWQSTAGTEIRKDEQLSPSFRFLLGRWMMQTSLANREDVLFHGMSWDMPQCRLVAIDTILNENDASPAVIAKCLQALAKSGTVNDLPAISTLLNDQRPVSRPSITTQGTRTNQVSDLAIAAIACICGVDLEDVGFTGATPHPTFGFLPSDIKFPKDAPEQRQAAEKMIKAILKARGPALSPPGAPPLAPGLGN